MNIKALVAAPLVAWLLVAAAQDYAQPASWSSMSTGNSSTAYVRGIDPQVTMQGKPALTIAATGQNAGVDFGSYIQYLDTFGWDGKRVRFSGYIRAQQLDTWAGVWMSADQDVVTSFDVVPIGVGVRQVLSDWTPISVVIDVPANARWLSMGFALVGNGRAWLSGVKFEEVAADVPVSTSRVGIDEARRMKVQGERLTKTKRPTTRQYPGNLELKPQ
jgi:hypothetical protein